MAKKHGAYFIVDEVQTGVGATGKFWAHEHWGLKDGEEPDFVTFSKKMQASGIYHKKELRPNAAYRIYGTWMVRPHVVTPLSSMELSLTVQGDPIRSLQARKMIELIEKHDLVSHTSQIGTLLADNLKQILSSSSTAQNLRGETKGTFMSWDFETPALRDGFVGKMRKEGIQMGGCGERSVRLRPMLTFGEQHVEILSEAVEKVLKGM